MILFTFLVNIFIVAVAIELFKDSGKLPFTVVVQKKAAYLTFLTFYLVFLYPNACVFCLVFVFSKQKT